MKTLESFYGTSYDRKNFLVEYKDDILDLPNRTPNGAFYPKVENIDEYNKNNSLMMNMDEFLKKVIN